MSVTCNGHYSREVMKEWRLFDKHCFHDEKHVFIPVGLQFSQSLFEIYLSVYYTSCFENHYSALMIGTLSSAHVATAQLTILVSLVTVRCGSASLLDGDLSAG